jgi:hypothetical protein
VIRFVTIREQIRKPDETYGGRNHPTPLSVSSTYKYNSSKKTLTVSVTTAMTAKGGHNKRWHWHTLLYQRQGKPPKLVQPQLPFELTKR